MAGYGRKIISKVCLQNLIMIQCPFLMNEENTSCIPKVSLLGVDSLWGDSTFNSADWGSW
jgi:hypothetical protein